MNQYLLGDLETDAEGSLLEVTQQEGHFPQPYNPKPPALRGGQCSLEGLWALGDFHHIAKLMLKGRGWHPLMTPNFSSGKYPDDFSSAGHFLT